ncbi:MAG: DUF4870 domain-containing protein [Armatimonadota bacterium]
MSENQPDSPESAVSPNDDGSSERSRLENQWGMFCHLAGLAVLLIPATGNIIGPLIIWLIKKDEFPFVNSEGKESLNFQISITLYSVIFAILKLVGVRYIVIFAIYASVIFNIFIVSTYVFVIVEIILAAIKTNHGIPYKYPLTIRFIK